MPTCGFIKVQPNGLRIKDAESTQKWDTVSKRMVKILEPQVVEVVPEPPEPVETFGIETLIDSVSGVDPVGMSGVFGLAIDRNDNIIACNVGTSNVVRVDGVTGIITPIAGNGVYGVSGDGGLATNASLGDPLDAAIDSVGNVFISDSFSHRIRRVDAVTGVITTVAGTGVDGVGGDRGPGTSAYLSNPQGVAVDSFGNIFIADNENHRIRRVDAGTGVITTIAGNGVEGFSGDGGPATDAWFISAYGVAVDGGGNVLITDSNRIRRVDAGTRIITTVAGNGTPGFSGDGAGATGASLSSPFGVAVDGGGNVLIADTYNHRIRRVDAVTGVITTIAGNGVEGFSGDGGPAVLASMTAPSDVVVDSIGNIFISVPFSNRIRRVDAVTGIITTFVGIKYKENISSYGDVTVTLPRGVTVSGSNIYVVNTDRHIIYVFNKNTGLLQKTYGTFGISGIFGSDFSIDNADGLRFDLPFRVAVDSVGNIYVADFRNNCIRRVNFPVGNTTTIAGGGQDINTTSGIATTKRLSRPNGVAVYGDIVYFTNTNVNNVCKVVNGQISTLPGVYSSPEGLTVDSLGNLYVANPGFNKITRVTPTNIVSDVALPSGTTLNYPRSVAIDTTGNIYISDSGNNRILRLNINNTVTVLATDLNTPMDVSVDTDGTVYVADYTSNRILKIYSTYV